MYFNYITIYDSLSGTIINPSIYIDEAEHQRKLLLLDKE